MFFFLFGSYNILLIAAAVIPAIVLLVRVYRSDRLEKEPVGMLIGLFFLGIISTTLAGITEELGSGALTNLFPNGGLISDALLYFVVVAVSEEGFKYLLLKIRTWKISPMCCASALGQRWRER